MKCYIKCDVTFAWIAACLFITAELHAQTTLGGDHVITGDLRVGTSGTAGNLTVTGEVGSQAIPGLVVTGDGGVVFAGNHGLGGLPRVESDSGMIWYSKKSSLVVGRLSNLGLDDNLIGFDSMALGKSAQATGERSIAIGADTVSLGYSSIAMNDTSSATGDYSVAMGFMSSAVNESAVAVGFHSSAIGRYAFATGVDTWAIGASSTAMGVATSAMGEGSSAMGNNTTSAGYASFAVGLEAVSLGTASVAMGDSARAIGEISVAAGLAVKAKAFASFVIGQYNEEKGNEGAWIEGDPVFVIGNGTGNPSDLPEVKNRNAFTVKKNGDVKMTGKVEMPRQGDILMGEFGD